MGDLASVARKDWGPLILLLGWGGLVYLFLAGIPFQNFRFGLTLYPPFVRPGRIRSRQPVESLFQRDGSHRWW